MPFGGTQLLPRAASLPILRLRNTETWASVGRKDASNPLDLTREGVREVTSDVRELCGSTLLEIENALCCRSTTSNLSPSEASSSPTTDGQHKGTK
ncbi:hypothetical protein T265_04779 [Opisthorchis viverrini]|uniref:Uncharacterized protein n=1 Tax=Opisthorchis viverrini TaxID=6198 RepID=A0A075AG52_OPIVI|nr:hypothetical protein T265_04779 [Opisthorchis viverrini]KER28399.1 hypothetical protein T265_04779 [Opisthorchis viverrini]